MSAVALEALQVAISQIGQLEHPRGSNWGEPVRTYLASVYIDFPASWCAAFIHWTFEQAARKLGVPNPHPKNASVLKGLAMVDKSHISFTPIPGDVFIMDFGHGVGHTGIVERFDNDFIYTVDGNTNDLGSREGYEVCRRQRKRTTIKCYMRL